MGFVYRKQFTKPIPIGSVIVTRRESGTPDGRTAAGRPGWPF
jgi:hypothetical protein